jgi:hypothetical protein
MQQPERTTPAVKGLFSYFRDIIRFHDAGSPRFVQVLFVLMLAVLYGSVLLMAPHVRQLDILQQGILTGISEASTNEAALSGLQAMMTPERQAALLTTVGAILSITLVARVLVQGMAILYGYVWHAGHLATGHTLHQVMRAFVFRLPRLVLVNLLFFSALLVAGIAISVVFGILGVLLPVFAVLLYVAIPILYLVVTALFSFRDLSVLSGRTRVLETFSVCWRLSSGNRRPLVGNVVLLNVLAMLISSVAGGNAAGSPVAAFVVTFMDVIVLLITQRLIVRMYEDARGLPVVHVEPGNP